MRSTGIVNEVFEWVDAPDGKRRPGTVQARDEDTGMPLWDVEVVYQQVAYGRTSNTTSAVRVGSPVRPVLPEFTPVAFVGLTVEVRALRESTGLSESWRAEALADDKSAGSGVKAAS
jgi:hypothetical protein